jgi:pyruvate ferredoxin oxidoreductase alpha subunit
MKRKTMEGSKAIAETAKNCDPDVVACYPITSSVHIAEELAKFYSNGELRKFVAAESEFGAISILQGASAAGGRTFTATSGQGLALMNEVLFSISGMRLPIVMVVGNRALSSPLNIWNDHQDTISERDAGWVQIYCESNQEACDSVPIAFKLAESTLLPVMVCIDGYYLTHSVEQIDFLSKEEIKKFLPHFNPKIKLDPKNPLTLGVYAFPEDYQMFREDLQKDTFKAKTKLAVIEHEFKKMFGRSYECVDKYKINDADRVIVGMGSVMGNVKEVVDNLRKKGEKVGCLRVRLFRPFPYEEVERALKGKKVGVFEKAISIGGYPPLYGEVVQALNGGEVSSFVGGLGGKDINFSHIEGIFKKIKEGKKKEWIE